MEIAVLLVGIALIVVLLWGIKIIRKEMYATEKENLRLERDNRMLKEENHKLKRNG
jgi:uncharacterized protein YneF (UPF0154 family)